MSWFTKSTPPPTPEPSGELRDEVVRLRSEVSALRRDLDDLDDTFRRFRSRMAKRQSVDDAEQDDGPAPALPGRGGRQAVGSVAALKRSGRWPIPTAG